MTKQNEAEAIQKLMSSLKCSEKEAREIYNYDRAVDKGEKTVYDLTAEQQKIARKYTHAGARKAPTVYKLEARKRKPNATKGAIIAALAEWLEHTEDFSAESIAVTNKERQITFQSAGETFELTLVQKRKPK